MQSQMNMVPIVQLVRASDCGSECRGFESHWAPRKEVARLPFFCTRWSPLYQEKGTSSNEDVPLCGRRESNPYASRHQILSLACLPISTRPRMCIYIPSGTDCKDTIFFQFSKKRMQLIILHQDPGHVDRKS